MSLDIDIPDVPAFIIEVGELAAGLAIRERGGFSFVASDRRFRLLEGSKFRRVNQIENAAKGLLRAANPR